MSPKLLYSHIKIFKYLSLNFSYLEPLQRFHFVLDTLIKDERVYTEVFCKNSSTGSLLSLLVSMYQSFSLIQTQILPHEIS